MASIGTPFGSSHSGAMAGHWLAGEAKRAFGWAAGSPDAGSCGCPFQLVRPSGAVLVIPSHHTSPSAVRAVLVKMVLVASVSSALGLVSRPVPGATPKKPASGFTAYSRPSSPNRIQAMSSPMVSAFQPGRLGCSMARLVLPQAEGKAAATYFDRPLGSVSFRISICSASQPSSRAMTEAIRSA